MAICLDKINKFAELAWREQCLYLKSALWLIVVKAGLLVLGFARIRDLLEQPGQPSNLEPNLHDMTKVILAVNRTANFLSPLHLNCLPQALVGRYLLRQRGFEVNLKIGVQKDKTEQLAAHAWLEHHGKVVLGDVRYLHRFTTLPSLDLAKR